MQPVKSISSEFGICTYISCDIPACYKWLDENKLGQDITLFCTCPAHSKLICELQNKVKSAQNPVEKKFAKGEYRAAINLAKYHITKPREFELVNPE